MNALKVLLKPNFERDNTARVLREVAGELEKFGAMPMLEQSDLEASGISNCTAGTAQELLEACDVNMKVGGDGTVLAAAADAMRADKPLNGVNSGRVGFLTQLESSELGLLERLARREYKVQGRMLIEAVVEIEGERRSHTALNDVVVRCEDANRILTFSVLAGGRPLLRQRADGVIFATPTGSTAYSLSAGGPVVLPDVPAMVLTPICPHGTFRCSLVLAPDGVYTVTEEGGREQGFMLSVDGTHYGCYHKIEIIRSKREIKIIDLGCREFYRNLSEKLGNNH